MNPLANPERATLGGLAPRTPAQLYQWIRLAFGVEPPRDAIAPGSSAPFDYLRHAVLERSGPRDVVVWASRGAGKTFYGALATAIELILKPTIEIVILGGSLEQSKRMYEHLRRLASEPPLARYLEGDGAGITDRAFRLSNGSIARVLSQSHTSVRGVRPQVLRCDEVELFKPDIWRAAQLVTRSKRCGPFHVAGRVEALSTWSRPVGVMADLVADGLANPPARRLMRWNVVDVLESCDPARACGDCALEPDCGGRAKRPAGGHVTIDDALALRARSDQATWEAEMLCQRPTRSDAVYPELDPDHHVASFDPPTDHATWFGGIDFGLRSPTVVLWACVGVDGVLRVVDERVAAGCSIAEHARAIHAARWPAPAWFGVDPAGAQRSQHTAISPIHALRREGLIVRSLRAPLEAGLRAVRARLAPATGTPTLLIHQRCARLIESMLAYRYPESAGHADRPVKDGPDHAADALRYLVVNLDARGTTGFWRYA